MAQPGDSGVSPHRDDTGGAQTPDVDELSVRRPRHASGMQHGLIPDILKSVTRSVSRRPSSVLWLVSLLVVLSLGISARFLSFKTDRSDLIDADSEFQQRWLAYTERFGDNSDVVVVVESKDTATIKQVLSDLGGQLELEPQLFDRVFYKFDPATLRKKGLQYLPADELRSCLASLEEHEDVLSGRWDRAGLQSTTENLNKRLKASDAVVRGEALHTGGKVDQQSQRLCISVSFTLPGPFLSRTPINSEPLRLNLCIRLPSRGRWDFG
ncbi:MAG: hypothetical protein R3B91_11200 [Planctomycetaceae bacterium]